MVHGWLFHTGKAQNPSSHLVHEAGSLSSSSLVLMGWLADVSEAAGPQSTLETQRSGL